MKRLNAFYSGRQLVSVNQFALAGPTRSRGYKINTFFADDGVHLGTDLLFEGWFQERLQPYLMADAAYGVAYLQDPIGDEEERDYATLVNAGLGCKFLWKNFRGNISLAYPLETSLAHDPELEAQEDAKWYFDMQYSF